MSSIIKENLCFIRSLVSKSIEMFLHCFPNFSSRISLQLKDSVPDDVAQFSRSLRKQFPGSPFAGLLSRASLDASIDEEM